MRYNFTVTRQSGYVAGWFVSQSDAQAFAGECNASVPSDPASVVALDWGAWDAFCDEVLTA